MKTKSIPKQYKKYLDSVIKEVRKAKKPISKEMLSERLSSKFNLSPEYCTEVVNSLY